MPQAKRFSQGEKIHHKFFAPHDLQVAASIGAAVLENLLCAQCFPVLSTELPKLF
jgi:hypothetical protein